MRQSNIEAPNCKRCGGPIVKQNVLNGEHRHFPDCIAFLKRLAAFGDQCYQDQCENAYIERTQHKRVKDLLDAAVLGKSAAERRLASVCGERDNLRKQVADLESELERHATDRNNFRKDMAVVKEAYDARGKEIARLQGALGGTCAAE